LPLPEDTAARQQQERATECKAMLNAVPACMVSGVVLAE
jgi:hypothetical protein